MIKSLQISNFQAHKETKLELDSGVNVIAGASDAGKSSILRALLWVINNRPSGDSVRNYECKKGDSVDVRINLGKDGDISKQRVEGKSIYKKGNKKFEAFKQDVPSEISEALNLSDINIQAQHDSYFLLKDSPGEVARKLNEITGLDIIDRLFKYINGKASASKKQAEDAEKSIMQITTDIESLSYIDKLEKELNDLEELVEEYDKKLRKNTGVITIMQSIGETDEKISEHNKLIGAQPAVEGLLDCCSSYDRKNDQINTINDIISNLMTIDIKLDDERDWLSVESEYESISNQVEEWIKKDATINDVHDLIKRVTVITGDIVIEENKTLLLKTEYESLLKKHKICPLCGSKVDSKLINTII